MCKFLLIYKVFRVHWLRARAQKQRWAEELILVKHEMQWTLNFYMYTAQRWQTRRDMPQPEWERQSRPNRGRRAYAEKQIAMWNSLAEVSENAFRVCGPDIELHRVNIA